MPIVFRFCIMVTVFVFVFVKRRSEAPTSEDDRPLSQGRMTDTVMTRQVSVGLQPNQVPASALSVGSRLLIHKLIH